MSFRVSELQVLLGFAGRNKSGRKQELLNRALQLIDKGTSTPIQIKVRELYRRRFPPKPTGSPGHHQGMMRSPPPGSHNVHGSPPASASSMLHRFSAYTCKNQSVNNLWVLRELES